jgi:hypothetical protein
MAAEAVVNVVPRIPKVKSAAAFLIGLAYAGLTITPLYAEVKDMEGAYKTFNSASYFLPDPLYRIMKSSRDISGPSDIFLIPWPYNSPFPGLTGRRVYFSEALLSIQPDLKSRFLADFFTGQMDHVRMNRFLSDNRITYIIGYSWQLPDESWPNLTRLKDEGGYSLWKVNNYIR